MLIITGNWEMKISWHLEKHAIWITIPGNPSVILTSVSHPSGIWSGDERRGRGSSLYI